MTKLTQAEALATALTNRLHERIEMRSKKYVCFYRGLDPATGKKLYYFIGKNGALRTGLNAVSSHPMPEAARMKLLKEGGYVGRIPLSRTGEEKHV